MARRSRPLWLFAPLLLGSCAGKAPPYYDQVYAHLSAGEYGRAHDRVRRSRGAYAEQDEVLFLLDEGITAHFAGRYEVSNRAFARAERRMEDLYTESISAHGTALVTNDNALPYRGEDHENALVNVFMALNYAFMGRHEDALVEARKVDAKLTTINARYKPDARNVYAEDAFIRMVMGLLYESGGELNDAYISYVKSEQAYAMYAKAYGTLIPDLLVAKMIGVGERVPGLEDDVRRIRDRYPHIRPATPSSTDDAEIIFFHYAGRGPRKAQDSWVLADATGGSQRIPFPKFIRRPYEDTQMALVAARDSGGVVARAATVPGEDLGAIAIQGLENRIGRIRAKATVRAAVGQGVASIGSAVGAGWVTDLLRAARDESSGKADLRYWELLPDMIGIGQLSLAPGHYQLTAEILSGTGRVLEQHSLGAMSIQSGHKAFVALRTVR